jgi:release factor glutamine methyltransferase
LLAHTLRLRRVDLYSFPERLLTAEEYEAYRLCLERRAQQEPVSYIRGYKEFFGLTLAVDRRVLVPRPETELLVEWALESASTLARDDLCIADIGTGSGCIVVALATRLPRARFYATDISAGALELAGLNVRQHGAAGRVTLLLGDLCAPLPEAVNLLVSNPPYTVWESLPEGITTYEPRVALDGGGDGLEVYRRLLPQIPSYLRPGGTALLEIGDGQEEAVGELARRAFPGVPLQMWRDYSGWVRVVGVGPCEAG